MKNNGSSLTEVQYEYSTRPAIWQHVVWLAVFAALAILIQFSIPYPFDDDTAYHFSVARLLRQYGLLHSFPWTPFSWQSTHYADKELFFHLLFIPFTDLGFVSAARIVAAISGALVLSSMYSLLYHEKVRFPAIWTIIPLASSVFVFRFALVRPHLLSISLALIMIWALANRRLRILACCSFLFPLSYVAFWQIPLLLTVAAETSWYLAGKRLQWKPVAVSLSAVAAGVLLHPNSWNLVQLNWIHMSDILLSGAWGNKAMVELGNEFYPYSWREWSRFLAPPVIFTITALFCAWKDRHRSCTALAYVLSTIFFALLTLKSMRFLEYFVPFSVVAIAVATRYNRQRFLAPALLISYLIYTLLFGTGPCRALFSREARPGRVETETGRLFAEKIPKDAQVFTCSWDYTGELMLVLPNRKFIVAADPTLFFLNDPIRYTTWSRISELDPNLMKSTLQDTFNSRFVICENSLIYKNLFDALSSDPAVSTLLVDKQWVFFDLGGHKRK